MKGDPRKGVVSFYSFYSVCSFYLVIGIQTRTMLEIVRVAEKLRGIIRVCSCFQCFSSFGSNMCPHRYLGPGLKPAGAQGPSLRKDFPAKEAWPTRQCVGASSGSESRTRTRIYRGKVHKRQAESITSAVQTPGSKARRKVNLQSYWSLQMAADVYGNMAHQTNILMSHDVT